MASRAKKNNRLLIAGGGTGGHVLAGVAIADEWKKKAGPGAEVLFVGAKGGWEEKLVPRAGYSLELLKLGALNRVGLKERLRTLLRLPLALLKSVFVLMRYRPGAVVGVGGYASGPLLLTASLLRVFGGWSTAILEQNSVPGLTNRILGRLVKRVFAAFPGSEKAFGERKTLVTGNPIRSNITRMESAARDPFTVFIFGGSQGALGINSLIIEALPELERSGKNIRLIHQTGERDFDRVSQAYAVSKIPHRVEKFIYEMPECYESASLLICRAGSSTLSEVAAVGRAAVLVPLPTAADNHQEKNAQVFVERNAAMVFQQGPARGIELAKLILDFQAHPERISEMERNARALYVADAAANIADRLADR